MTNTMTKLIDLSDYRAERMTDRATATAGESARSARILLFTGVRYERMDEPVAARRSLA